MRARLHIEAGDGVPAVCGMTPGQPFTMGRNRGNSIVLQDKHASRWHAELTLVDGKWTLRDCGTLNGTRVDGERISQPTVLQDDQVIGIGETRLRFRCEVVDDDASSVDEPLAQTAQKSEAGEVLPAAQRSGLSQTELLADELTILVNFMTASLEESSHHGLILRALRTLHAHTEATVTGFLSLDPVDPLPKMVLPELARVDVHLSRQLTQSTQREGRTVWLRAPEGNGLDSCESLMSFQDALCVPLCAGGAPLGALHVYRVGKLFTEREVRFCEVLAGHLATSLRVLRSRRTLEAENSRLRGHAPATDDQLIGDSPVMQQLGQQIARFAPRSNTILIVGETGSGKELVALALHRNSPRRDGPLVIVNCAAIAASLPEAELFGHRKGAFTGATQDHPGYFEQADEGTLFLDEIGELSLECQAKLLRVIEGKGFRPVGAIEEIRPDVRILAATHRDLTVMAQDGCFRQDLLYRLGMPIRVPPLRAHPEDIAALVQYFLVKISAEHHRSLRLSERALERLKTHSWPGNVRQLLAVLQNAAAMSDATELDVDDLFMPDEVVVSCGALPSLNLEELESRAIELALKEANGHVTRAAEILGIHRDTLSSKMKKYEIKASRGH